jgi:hypothetical protein
MKSFDDFGFQIAANLCPNYCYNGGASRRLKGATIIDRAVSGEN